MQYVYFNVLFSVSNYLKMKGIFQFLSNYIQLIRLNFMNANQMMRLLITNEW